MRHLVCSRTVSTFTSVATYSTTRAASKPNTTKSSSWLSVPARLCHTLLGLLQAIVLLALQRAYIPLACSALRCERDLKLSGLRYKPSGLRVRGGR